MLWLWFNSDWGLLFTLCPHDLSRDENRGLTSPSKAASGHAWPFTTIGVIITKLEALVLGTYKIVVSCWIVPFFDMCWLSLSLLSSFGLQSTLFHIRIVTLVYFQVFLSPTPFTQAFILWLSVYGCLYQCFLETVGNWISLSI